MSFKPSKYQKTIFDFIKKDNRNAVINAVAGSGKTTTIIKSISQIPKDKNILFLAFNKSIKKEIDKRLVNTKHDVNIATCHSFGYSTILQSFNGDIILDNKKYKNLLNDIIQFNSTNNESFIEKYSLNQDILNLIPNFIFETNDKGELNFIIKNITELINLMRLYLYDDISSLDFNELIEKYDIVLSQKNIELAADLLKIGNSIKNIIDYTDMIYLPYVFNLKPEVYDFVFIDECQDLNMAQIALMRSAINPNNGRFIAVGDKNQAIYGFAGANDKSFDYLSNLPNTTILPLSVSYRCGKSIIESVKYLVPNIESYPQSPDGEIVPNASYKDINSGDMVLCRNTFPLVKLCLLFIKERKKANVIGNDIANSIITQIQNTNETSLNKAIAKLYTNADKFLQRIIKTKNISESKAISNAEYQRMIENIIVIQSIKDELPNNSDDINDVITLIYKIFDDDASGIVLSTVHKAKGLEANNVFIIHSELMPSKYAIKDWEVQQEKNIIYVAKTRAISKLNFVVDFDAYKYEKNNKPLTITKTEHAYNVGDLINLNATITNIKFIEKLKTELYLLTDSDNNIFEHWGPINKTKLINKTKSKKLSVGQIIKANAKIIKLTSFDNNNHHRIKI